MKLVKPKKNLGQHFLTDLSIARQIADTVDACPDIPVLEIAIHQFAKRQMTWFRGMERLGFTIHWVNAAQKMEDKVEEII